MDICHAYARCCLKSDFKRFCVCGGRRTACVSAESVSV
jgi:hypothetical protein